MSGTRPRRDIRHGVITYLVIIGGAAVAVALTLSAGRHIEAVPAAPAVGVVGTDGQPCFGERVLFDQSGVFLGIRADVGEVGISRSTPVMVDGRLDRRSGVGVLSGSCAPDAALAGEPAQVRVELSGERGAVRATMLRPGDSPVSFDIEPGAEAGGTASARPEALSAGELAGRVLLAVAVVMVVARVVGSALTRLHQPRVIGEIVAGILLGPSLLGVVAPGALDYLFPAEVIGALRVLAQTGLVFFMFLIGLELDLPLVRRSARSAVLISHVSIALPLALGTASALVLFPLFGTGDFTPFALFIGAAMAVTAFPVLARILTDTGLHRTRIGAVALACAAIDDVTAWCLLAAVVGLADADGASDALRVTALGVVYVAVMIGILRPLAARLLALHEARGRSDQTAAAVILIVVLLSAWTTEWIGIHAIFGAFLAGAVMPRGRALLDDLAHQVEAITLLLLLPVFFAVVGLTTRLGLVDKPELWALTGLVLVVAVVGKWGGSMVAARASGESWRAATAIGILMNTRGLTEIVILTIGREIGILSPALFAIMVLMALVTTLMATPLLAVVYPRSHVEREAARGAAARRIGQGRGDAHRVVIGIGDVAAAGGLIDVAAALRTVRGTPPAFQLTHVAPRSDGSEVRGALRRARHVTFDLPAVEPIADRLRIDGAEVQVITAFGDQPATTIRRVAQANEAAVVLVGQHHSYIGDDPFGGLVAELLADVTCDVAVVLDPPEVATAARAPVGVLVGAERSNAGALELGLALARGLDVGLVLLDPDAAGGPDPFKRPPDVPCERRPVGDSVDAALAVGPLSVLIAALTDDGLAPLAIDALTCLPCIVVRHRPAPLLPPEGVVGRAPRAVALGDSAPPVPPRAPSGLGLSRWAVRDSNP